MCSSDLEKKDWHTEQKDVTEASIDVIITIVRLIKVERTGAHGTEEVRREERAVKGFV